MGEESNLKLYVPFRYLPSSQWLCRGGGGHDADLQPSVQTTTPPRFDSVVPEKGAASAKGSGLHPTVI